VKDEPINSKTDMRCQSVQESVLARLDNEPDEIVWSQVEKHLLSCKECAGFAEKSIMMNARLREELKDDRNTSALWSRIARGIDAEAASTDSMQATVSRGKAAGGVLAAGAVVAVMMAAIFAFPFTQSDQIKITPLAVKESMNDFLTFKASGRDLDVDSNEPLELRRWLVKRLDFEVPLSSAMPAGFKLAGARLCAFLNRRSAAFMYHMDGNLASVYVMAETGLDATLKRVPRNNELTVFLSRGLTNVVWRNDGLLYVVVADFSEKEAVRFAKSIGDPVSEFSLKVTSVQDNSTFFRGKPRNHSVGKFTGERES